MGTRGIAVPIIPPPEEPDVIASNVRLPSKRWEDLQEIADNETEKARAKGIKKVFSRAEIIDHILKWGAEQYWKEEGGRPGTKKR